MNRASLRSLLHLAMRRGSHSMMREISPPDPVHAVPRAPAGSPPPGAMVPPPGYPPGYPCWMVGPDGARHLDSNQKPFD